MADVDDVRTAAREEIVYGKGNRKGRKEDRKERKEILVQYGSLVVVQFVLYTTLSS